MRGAGLPRRGWDAGWDAGRGRGGGRDVRCARGSGCAGTAGGSEAAGERTGVGCWRPAAPLCGSSRRRLAPLHHVRPAGVLRARVARDGGTISGTAGRAGPPGSATLLPEANRLPFLLPRPGRWAPAGPGGCPWPDSGGRWPAWARALPRPSAAVLHRLGAPSGSPLSPALAPGPCSAPLPRCRKLVCRLRGEVPGVSMWGRPEGTGIRWDSEQPSPHLRRGLLEPHPHPLGLGSSTAPPLW